MQQLYVDVKNKEGYSSLMFAPLQLLMSSSITDTAVVCETRAAEVSLYAIHIGQVMQITLIFPYGNECCRALSTLT